MLFCIGRSATLNCDTKILLKSETLSLNSSGKKFEDAGFYFLLNDIDGNYWTQYKKSFCDKLTIGFEK